MHEFTLKSISTPEFDYNLLMSLLSQYSQPWAKIRQMLIKKQIIRVKKGLYVKGPGSDEPYSECLLANMIYGPSYVSGTYAMSWYGLIPEKVTQITSVTTKTSKTFRTPVGVFSYKHLAQAKYATGFLRSSIDNNRCFLIATSEKALVDSIAHENIVNLDELLSYLTLDLRIDEHELRKLSTMRLREISRRYQRPVVSALFELVQGLKP